MDWSMLLAGVPAESPWRAKALWRTARQGRRYLGATMSHYNMPYKLFRLLRSIYLRNDGT
jgi:hypothetical protein